MDINDKLKELNASFKGDYWICVCPSCGRKEAFVYLDDVEKAKTNEKYKIPIRCNRANKCGVVNYIEDVQIESIPKVQEDDIIGINKIGYEKLNNLAYCNTLIIGYDIDWRGVSNSTLKNNGIIYLPKGFQNFIKTTKEGSFAPRFFKQCYENRDILIPIKNYEGDCERLLLRSTKQLGNNNLKEIGMRLVKRSSEVWNRKDLIDTTITHVFVTEGVPDGLSVKEVSQSIGVVSIPGVRKYGQLIKEIKAHYEECKDKTFVLCFDNDDAGREFEQKLMDKLDELLIKWQKFTPDYKDMNEFLQNDKNAFIKAVTKEVEGKFKLRRNSPAQDIMKLAIAQDSRKLTITRKDTDDGRFKIHKNRGTV